MWTYNKILQYPINIKCKDPRLAKVIISQNAKAILNDIGTEELRTFRNGWNYCASIN